VSVTEPAAAPRSSNARVIASIVVVVAFIAGLLVGAVADRIYLFRHGPPHERHGEFVATRIVDKLDRELKFTPQQKQQVTVIVTGHGHRMEALWGRVRPEMRQEIDAANKEISAVLTPEQRVKFDKLRMRLGPRGPRKFGGPPPPPPN
jgi:Spy/CpxP family protein refolding chaperone